MLIVNLYCSTVRALAMPYNKVMLIKPNKASKHEVLNGYVTNPNPTPTLTPNRNPNSNPNRINKKIQKKTDFRK
jgi:hypothetical protein